MDFDIQDVMTTKLSGDNYWTSKDGELFVILNRSEAYKIACENAASSVHLMDESDLSYATMQKAKDIRGKSVHEILDLIENTIGYEKFSGRAVMIMGIRALLPEVGNEEHYVGCVDGIDYFAYKIDKQKTSKLLH